MNKQEQEAFFNAFVEKMRATMLAKGDDYAGQDRLDNFKRAGAITGIGAPMQCLSLIATKVARLSSLVGGNKDPRNESVDDSILDLANYSVILAMVIQDLLGSNMTDPDSIIKMGSDLKLTRLMYEQDLPDDISDELYNHWYSISEVIHGVRIGPDIEDMHFISMLNLSNVKNIDINDEPAPVCATCGRQMRIVRPGEYECVKRKCNR
jgi:hypothetical protein